MRKVFEATHEKEGWRSQPLESLCEVNPETLSASTPPSDEFRYLDISAVENGRIHWIDVPTIRFKDAPSRARRVIRKGDVLLCTVRPGLQSHAMINADAPLPLVCSTGFAVLRAKRNAVASFIFHTLFDDSISRQLRALETGSNYPAVNEGDVRWLGIYAPNRDEQESIAMVLDTVNEAIAKTEAVIAKLRQVRAGLLHDLLTRGLDENGNLRDPIAHPEQFRDFPLGRLPRKWQILRLEDASVKVQDGTHFSPKSTSGPRRYVTSKNIRFGFLDLTDCGWVSEAEHKEIYGRCDVKKFDILLTKDGANTGNAALNILDEEFSLLSSVALIRCRHGLSHHDFLLNYLLSPLGQKRLKHMMSGNAITRLTLQKIKNFVVPLPPFDEQINIAEQVRACGDHILSIENESLKLTKIKSGLMSDLLTGRVRVPENLELAK